MKSLKKAISDKFPITDKGPITFFLNMHFHRDRVARTVTLHQIPKIEKLLEDSRLCSEDRQVISKPCKTPAADDPVLNKDMCPTDPAEIARMETMNYKSFVGMLLYIAITARPDLAPSVSAAARFSQNPGRLHWDAVLRILRYLQGTRNLKLKLGGKLDTLSLSAFSKVSAYSDSDWATETDMRRSRTGYAIYLANSLVVWCSKLQLSTALSSTEAEYIALAATTREVIWTRALLSEMGFKQSQPSAILEDNHSCIKIAESYKAHPAIKHIDIRHHFIRDRVLEIKDIALEKVATGNNTADLFTKQLAYPLFKKHRDALGMV